MMDTQRLLDILNLALIGFSLIVVGVMLFRGALRERALALGPDRDLNLPGPVNAVGAAIVIAYVVMMLVASESGSVWIALLAALLPLLLLGALIGRAVNAEAGFRKIGLLPRHPKRDTVWAGVAVVLAFGLAGGVGWLMTRISEAMGAPVDPIAHQNLQDLIDNPTGGKILALMFTAVILAPLLEEVVFRGVLQTCLLRLFGERRWWAILYAAALFSVTHVSVVPWQMFAPLFVLGVVFGYLYERTGSLLTPILAHAGFNALNIGLALVMPTG